MIDRRLLTNIDWMLVGLVIATCLLGIMNIYSATTSYKMVGSPYYLKQFYWMTFGMGIALMLCTVDYHLLEDLSFWLYGFLLVLLVAVLLFGRRSMGATRWLNQPSSAGGSPRTERPLAGPSSTSGTGGGGGSAGGTFWELSSSGVCASMGIESSYSIDRPISQPVPSACCYTDRGGFVGRRPQIGGAARLMAASVFLCGRRIIAPELRRLLRPVVRIGSGFGFGIGEPDTLQR